MMRRRKIVLLLIPVLLLGILWVLLASNWGLGLSLRIASAVIPGEFSVSEQQGSLLGEIHLRGVRYHNQDVTVSIQQLDLAWQLRHLLYGKLSVQHLTVQQLAIEVPASTTSPVRQSVQPEKSTQHTIILPLAIDVAEANINGITIKTSDTGTPVLIDRIHLNARASGEHVKIRTGEIQAYQSDARLSGTLALSKYFPMQIALDLAYQMDATHRFVGSGTVTGDLRQLQLKQSLSGPAKAQLDAQLRDVLNHFNWHVQFTQLQLNVHDITAASPSLNVQGELAVSGDLKAMQAKSQLQVQGPSLGSATLQVKADSDLLLNAYRFVADGDYHGVELPKAGFSVKGQGDLKHIELTQVAIQTLQGHAKGNAQVSWLPQFALNAKLDLHNIQTGLLAKDWPGQLNGQLLVQTDAKAKAPLFQFTLQDLTGKLRDQPVQAQAKGNWAEGSLVLDSLNASLGDTTLRASGQLAKRWDLKVEAHSTNLGSLLRSAKGQFELQGRLSGSATKPRAQLNATAKNLAYADQSIAAIKLALDIGLDSQAPALFDLQASDMETHVGHWNTLHLQMRGTNALQQGSVSANTDVSTIEAKWHGTFTPWRWQGSLDRVNYTQSQLGTWELQQPAAILLAQKRISFSSLCLQQATAHLCAQLQWNGSRREASLNGKAVPLSLIEPWLPSDLLLKGELDMTGTVNLTNQDQIHGHLSVHSTDQSIQFGTNTSKKQLTLGASSLEATLDDQGLLARVQLPLTVGGGIESDISLPHWSPLQGLPRTQALHANLKIEHVPANLISHFFPDTVHAEGFIQTKLQINGSLGQPRVHGDVQWQDGKITVPLAGVTIHDIQFKLASAQTNTLAFHIRARSGEGDAQVDGEWHLDPEKGWPLQLTLVTQKLEVSNIPEAHIIVNSNINVHVQGNTVNLDGDVIVPHARLRPHTLPEGAVPVSPDVVVIRSEKQVGAVTRWLLTSHLRLQLGDDVEFDGFGIRGKLRGKLALIDEPGKLLVGQGELSIVDGVYRMSGQDLDIRRGKLMFSNTFIDDPALDVEAVRTIDTTTAGVRLKGTLKQPQLTVFSEPTMSESDALSYLLFGHAYGQGTTAESQSVSNKAMAFNFVAGEYLEKSIGKRLGLDELRVEVNETSQNTSLILGKYLSPKFVVRYAAGIAESSQLIQLQYQVSKRVLIQTESGYVGSQPTTGGDIFLTIEY